MTAQNRPKISKLHSSCEWCDESFPLREVGGMTTLERHYNVCPERNEAYREARKEILNGLLQLKVEEASR